MKPADRETLVNWIVFVLAACAVLALISIATSCAMPVDSRDPLIPSSSQPVTYPRPSEYPR